MRDKIVRTRKDFVSQIHELLLEINDDYEIRGLSGEDFLERISAYAQDVDKYYHNFNLDIDADEPSWENFMNIIKGACVYE